MGGGKLFFFAVATLTLGLASAACQKTEQDGAVGGTGGSGGTIPITDGSGGADPVGTGGAPPNGTGGSIVMGSGGAPVDAPGEVAPGSGGAGGAPVDAPVAEVTPERPPDMGPLPPECNTPSINRYQQWLVASEMTATTVPAQGSILIKDGDQYVGRATFGAGRWHIIAVWLGNVLNTQIDLSASPGFTLTYSSTATMYVQLRAASNYNSGNHFLVELGSTGGQMQTVFLSFDPAKWTALPRLGNPTMSFADALKQVRALTFVGDVANVVNFRGLRVEEYAPPCL